LTGFDSGVNHGNQASVVDKNELDLFLAIEKNSSNGSLCPLFDRRQDFVQGELVFLFEYIPSHVVARALSLVYPPWSPACRDTRRDAPPSRPAADVIVGQQTPAAAKRAIDLWTNNNPTIVCSSWCWQIRS
jgi:hypothetical protein